MGAYVFGMRSLGQSSTVVRAGGALRPEARRRVLTRALLVSVLAFIPAPADAQSPMIQGWLAVNTACKGGPSDDPKTQKACARRDELGAKLKRRGCDYREDGDWWQCPH
jgi:hypothetical protein